MSACIHDIMDVEDEMKKIQFILGGPVEEKLPDSGLLVGVDYGAFSLAKRKRRFDLAIGDFDSVTACELETIRQYARKIVFLPCQKDETDTEFALQYFIKRGYHSFHLCNSIGGRFDHSLANVILAKRLVLLGNDIDLSGKRIKVRILRPGSYVIKRRDYPFRYCSFFALSEQVQQLTLEGFCYPLNEQDLSMNDIYTISNELKSDEARITFSSGLLLLVNTEDGK